MRPVAALAAVVVVVLAALLPASRPRRPPGGLRLVLTDMTPRVVTADGPDHAHRHRHAGQRRARPGHRPAGPRPARQPAHHRGPAPRRARRRRAHRLRRRPVRAARRRAGARRTGAGARCTVPLRGSGLALDAAGVHELLVNVNGTPAGRRPGPPRRRPHAAPGARPARRGARPAARRPGAAHRALPDRRAARTGSPPCPAPPPLLDDDSLAASFATTGRLGGLVAALAQRAPVGLAGARRGSAWPSTPTSSRPPSVMSQGYQVVGPGGAPTAGTGAAVAGQWLAQLAAVAEGRVRRRAALRRRRPRRPQPAAASPTPPPARSAPGGRSCRRCSQTPVPADIAWPADGMLDNPTLDVVQASGARSVLLSADAVTGRARGGVVPLAGRPVTALLTDPLLTRAADRAAGDPGRARARRRGHRRVPRGRRRPARPRRTSSARWPTARAPSAPVVVAPPHQWRTDGAGARALLDAVGALVTAGEVDPGRPRRRRRGAPPPPRRCGPTRRWTRPRCPASAIGTLADAARDLTDLRSAVVDGNVGITADQLFAPLQFGLLRGASAANRDAPAAAQDAAARRAGAGGRDPQLDPGAGAAEPVRAGQLRRPAPDHRRERAARHRAGAGGAREHVRAAGQRRSTCSRSRRSAAARCR